MGARARESVAAPRAELDALITGPPKGWTADRLGAVEQTSLRVAMHELDPATCRSRVAIDEAVAFAKRYASDEAGEARERDPRSDPARPGGRYAAS